MRSDNSVSCGITGWGYETDNKGTFLHLKLRLMIYVPVTCNKFSVMLGRFPDPNQYLHLVMRLKCLTQEYNKALTARLKPSTCEVPEGDRGSGPPPRKITNV